MLVARAAPAGPEWKPVLGASVLFAPIDRGMMRRARKAALLALGRQAEDAGDGADLASVEEQIEDLGDALSHALLMEGVKDWRDVCQMADADDEGPGAPLDCTDETKAMLFADPITFDAFDQAYVIPFVTRERERAAPGKDSPPSPNGTGPAETGAATTAASPARQARAADAPSAPTPSTRRKPTKKKRSGASSRTANAS
ncbi:hypothetical protein GGQ80_002088 [Sphingomonas jinjuensis]|uniref:Uncharacterized protein n=1 Tax=Sphingomonas jinjuensis TaxID=535907 RepID=A0A840FJP1_9SPHN|nr:hypothetical protein [Sphingomonas jinjuensis]MBB4154178.1 hypothetical protein [Sphingomonas jinjuensis]